MKLLRCRGTQGFLRQKRSLHSDRLESVSWNNRHTREITAVKANSIRLNAPDDLPNRNGTGRVEVFHNGEWGTICDRDWDIADAQVVCSNLGLIKAIHEARAAKYGEGKGKIWLSGVQCTGEELDLNKCEHKPYGEVPSSCTHRNDAGVKCLQTGLPQIIEVGCYRDRPKRALRDLVANLRNEIDWYNVRSMVTKCAERAHQQGYNMFGIQFYGECWADKQAEDRYDMHGKTHTCFEVWSCYKEAKKRNIKYFAVQFFGECWASNSPTLYRKYGKTATCWSGVGFQNTNYVYKLVN